jgi:hypothetical protein
METDVRPELTLGWKGGAYVQSHIIYLGESPEPDSVFTQTSSSYDPGLLEPNTTYYWRIDEVNAFGRAEGPVWSFTTGEENSGDEIIYDYCDSPAGWNSSNGISIDTEEKKVGYASLKSEGAGTDWFKKSLGTPLNTFCDTSSYLDLWVYVSDVSKFNGGGQLEITSHGGPDTDEYNWSVGDLNLVNGWNELHLKISSANIMGNPDLSAINFFRFYQHVSGDVTSRVDHIKFSGIVFESLAAPTNLMAVAGDGSVSLDWDDNPESSVSGYNIYRSFFSGVPGSKVNTEVVGSSEYTDTDLLNGTTYYYSVKAVDQAGNESESSDEVAATPLGNTLVSTIQDMEASIYPNPVDDQLYIEVKNGVSARMFDFTGRMVKYMSLHHQQSVLSVSDLESGQYLLELTTTAGSKVYKLIKK